MCKDSHAEHSEKTFAASQAKPMPASALLHLIQEGKRKMPVAEAALPNIALKGNDCRLTWVLICLLIRKKVPVS